MRFNVFRGFITALRTLTLLPVPGKEAERAADSLYFFPFIGELLGGLTFLIAWPLAVKFGWTFGAACAGTIILTLLTRFMHLDGLSDTVDACLASTDRARRLEIMKDPHIGSFGVAVIVFALLCKVVSMERLMSLGHWDWLFLPLILSRTIMVLLAVTLPYARAEGGKAYSFVKDGKQAHFYVAWVFALMLCFLHAGIFGLLVVLAALAFGLLNMFWMKRSFAGVTGDLLGFAGETMECFLYFLLAMVAGWL